VDDPVVAAVRASYERGAKSWGSGPERVYRALAEALVAASPDDLTGRTVLDLGAGTGVASHAVGAVGAQAVGVDLAAAMLRHNRMDRPPGVVGDARHLPFRSNGFDAVVAAFSVNHVPGPHLALAEAGRVTRGGGMVLASTFSSRRQHPARAAVERVMVEAGYVSPEWCSAFRERLEPAVGDVAAFAATARAGGLVDVEVRDIDIDTGVTSAEEIAEWRMGLSQYVGFLASLDPDARAELRTSAIEAVADESTPVVSVLFLVARAA
jgi:ubiquinone/menaquinone biosynthesis C-methylase UbiE